MLRIPEEGIHPEGGSCLEEGTGERLLSWCILGEQSRLVVLKF